ncbi:hypothetical protein ACHAWC_007202 [Mediolabrus comicus]
MIARQLKFYAETYPKSSTAALIGATALSFVVGFIEVRDSFDATKTQHDINSSDTYADDIDADSAPSANAVTKQEAQLAAMLENAKNSSWQDNLRNAADAQQRFMLPGRDIDNGQDKPAYIKRIVDRSEEILQEDKARKEKEEEDRKDPFRSKFWK